MRHQIGLLHGGLRRIHLRISGAQRGLRIVDVLLHRGLLRQSPLPARIGVRLEARRLRRGQLRLRGREPGRIGRPCGLQRDTCIGELCFGLLQAPLRLIARGDVGARIDLKQQVAGLHPLIVVHVEGDDGPGHLRRDRDRVAIGVGIVGGGNVLRQVPVGDRAGGRDQHNERQNQLGARGTSDLLPG